ncbi:MAG: hypothetical protein M1817_005876 [Caeruleum heppii]|nr:MAG: hypothetical protein M1817_005876 [Caeruleum heppii]
MRVPISVQTATYLVAVCLFSISFLVFLNSSVSFVITDLIGIKKGVGDLVGTLGFVDELVALVACPFWGVLSDRVGVRTVCVVGYGIIGLALLLFVQAKNVYPQLLLARLFFSLGGAAASTMVTAILPSLTAKIATASSPETPQLEPPQSTSSQHANSPSVSSQLTVTPARLARTMSSDPAEDIDLPVGETSSPSPPRLAGVVGLFTGLGALLALAVFLPLPARFSQLKGVSTAQAVADSYYVVGTIALLVSAVCFLGLRHLDGEEEKGWRRLIGQSPTKHKAQDLNGSTEGSSIRRSGASYTKMLRDAVLLGVKDKEIGLSYLGGFVARASSVGISLFIPLFVNAYFISSGLCDGDPAKGTAEMKRQCRRAYVLAAELTGVSQLVALLLAPLLGYLSSLPSLSKPFNVPLLTGAFIGVLGYIAFAMLESPEAGGNHGSPAVFVIVALLGISQITAIVGSLGLLGSCVVDNSLDAPTVREDGQEDAASRPRERESAHAPDVDSNERSHLLGPRGGEGDRDSSLSHVKGSLAGVYSLSGGAGILLLTKLGGYLFDSLSRGAPFYMLALFNGVLLVAGIVAGGLEMMRHKRERPMA